MNVIDHEHVLASRGSQRDGPYTRRALEHVLSAVAETGATIELVDCADIDSYPETNAACLVPKSN